MIYSAFKAWRYARSADLRARRSESLLSALPVDALVQRSVYFAVAANGGKVPHVRHSKPAQRTCGLDFRALALLNGRFGEFDADQIAITWLEQYRFQAWRL